MIYIDLKIKKFIKNKGNAQNLNASVKATLEAAMSASIKIKTNSGMKLRWVRKKSSAFAQKAS